MYGKKITCFGKSMSDILTIKTRLFDDNDIFLSNEAKHSELYRSQTKREFCKICHFPLPKKSYYNNHGTDYFLCTECGHVNGEFDDGEQFSNALYESGLYSSEFQRFESEDYFNRMNAIYSPKIKFMIDSFVALEVDYAQFKFLDVGAGAGFATCAMHRKGLDVVGIEVSEVLVQHANELIGKELLSVKNPSDIVQVLKTTDRDVVIFFGVLEHMANLREILDAMQKNDNIRYVYFSVPMLSLTCALEVAFSDVYPRHQGGGGEGHTHLFTQKSIEWIFDNFGFECVATWDFGTDIMDLYRSLIVSLQKKGCSEDFLTLLAEWFSTQADAIQLLLDKSGFASETHIIAKVH